MATYAISDIHGNKKEFDKILKKIKFNESDTLYILGDVIDRGEYGIELLKLIMHTQNMHMILGNHELMMLNSIYPPIESSEEEIQLNLLTWFNNGGDITYNNLEKESVETINDILTYIDNLPLEINITCNNRSFTLVHACPKRLYNANTGETIEEFCTWERDRIFELSNDENITVFGHTPTCNFKASPKLEIYRIGNCIDIDCGAAYDDCKETRLACLCLDDMSVTYSR